MTGRTDASARGRAIAYARPSACDPLTCALIDPAFDLVLHVDRALRVRHVVCANGFASLARDGWLGRGLEELALPIEVVAGWRAAVERAFGGGEPITLEFRLPGTDGGRWYAARVVLEATVGEPDPHALIAVRNVSEIRETQLEIARRETYYRALIEQSTDIVSVIDPDGAIRYQSPSAQRILGYEPRELVGQNALGFLHPQDVPRVTAALQRGLVDPSLHPTETFRFRHRDGSWRYLEATGTNLLGDPAVGGLVVNSRDVTDRVQMEEQLRRREREIEALVENTPDAIARYDRDLRRVHANRALANMLGMSREDLVGTKLTAVGSLEHNGPLVEAVRRVFETGEPDTVEFVHPTARGLGTLEARIVPERGDDGAVHTVLAIARDITELKRAEHTLRRRTLELGQRVKELRCLYGVSEVLNDRRSANGERFQLAVALIPTGWQFPEVTGARLRMGQHEYRTANFCETPWMLEAPVDDGDAGSSLAVCYLEKRPQRDDGPFLKEEGMLLTALASRIADTVARRRAELALVQREAYFRALIDHTTDLVAVLDANSTMRYASPSHTRLLGYVSEELVGTKALDLIHPEDRSRIHQLFARGSAPGVPVPTEFRFKHQNGSWRTLEAIGVNLLAEPAVNGIVVNSRDITDRLELEDQFRQAQKMEAVGQLAGGVAHDFNNLLTVIDGNAEFLLMELNPQDPRRADAEEIKKAAQRAASLTRQLLAFSRRQVLQPRVLSVNGVVEDMDKMLRRLIGEDIELVTALSPVVPPVLADPGQLEQVLLNLCVNARDAMLDGGRLTIVTDVLTVGQDRGTRPPGLAPGTYVLIAVSDTGVGMSREVQGRIFEPFFTTKAGGTGLGLATVYGIVKQSEGHITVSSEPGAGTTFKIYLPQTSAEVAGAAAAERERQLHGTETILLVEDEAPVRAVMRRGLTEHGYRVIEAAAGPEAIEAVRASSEAIDLLVTDVIMPRMNGKELADRLAALRPSLKVLFVSGYTDDSIARHGILADGTFFLEKPFTRDTLLRKVRQVLGAGRTPAA